MDTILFALWLFLPAGLANAVPVFAAKAPLLRQWSTPLDLGKTYRGQRIFGDHKTIRGVVAGVLVATLVVTAQSHLFTQYAWVQRMSGSVDYASSSVWLLGPLLGLGALLGDAIKSFFKRRAGVIPGSSWFPWDQIDYVTGGLLLSSLVVRLSATDYLIILFVWFALHLISVYIGYHLGIRKAKI